MIEATSDAPADERTAPLRSSYAVKLSIFEGPLDLLLHLIRANEVDIGDIPIATISEQYLEYLDLMQLLDLDIAGEYLLMAATLAHIKSRMLLPSDPEAAEDGDPIDPRAELARRLAEYAVFKEAAQDLGRRPRLGRDVFPVTADLSQIPQPEPILTGTMVALMDAMRRVLAQLPEPDRHHRIQREAITIQDRMVAVMDRLGTTAPATTLFEDLLCDGERTRQRLMMTFLAILELAKRQAIRIYQTISDDGRPVGPVRVRLAVTEGGGSDV